MPTTSTIVEKFHEAFTSAIESNQPQAGDLRLAEGQHWECSFYDADPSVTEPQSWELRFGAGTNSFVSRLPNQEDVAIKGYSSFYKLDGNAWVSTKNNAPAEAVYVRSQRLKSGDEETPNLLIEHTDLTESTDTYVLSGTYTPEYQKAPVIGYSQCFVAEAEAAE